MGNSPSREKVCDAKVESPIKSKDASTGDRQPVEEKPHFEKQEHGEKILDAEVLPQSPGNCSSKDSSSLCREQVPHPRLGEMTINQVNMFMGSFEAINWKDLTLLKKDVIKENVESEFKFTAEHEEAVVQTLLSQMEIDTSSTTDTPTTSHKTNTNPTKDTLMGCDDFVNMTPGLIHKIVPKTLLSEVMTDDFSKTIEENGARRSASLVEDTNLIPELTIGMCGIDVKDVAVGTDNCDVRIHTDQQLAERGGGDENTTGSQPNSPANENFKRRNSNQGNHRCKCCKRKFQNFHGLQNHKLTQHSGLFSSYETINSRFPPWFTVNLALLNQVPEKPCQCWICGETIVHFKCMTGHIMISHPEEKPYICHWCLKVFPNQPALADHKEESHSACPVCSDECTCGFLKNYKPSYHRNFCIKCKSDFSSEYDLELHLLSVHKRRQQDRDSPVFQLTACPDCDLVFLNGDAVACHRERAHQNQIPMQFRCSKCPASFYSQRLLKGHEETHVRPVHCCLCGKSFKQVENYRRHICLLGLLVSINIQEDPTIAGDKSTKAPQGNESDKGADPQSTLTAKINKRISAKGERPE